MNYFKNAFLQKTNGDIILKQQMRCTFTLLQKSFTTKTKRDVQYT